MQVNCLLCLLLAMGDASWANNNYPSVPHQAVWGKETIPARGAGTAGGGGGGGGGKGGLQSFKKIGRFSPANLGRNHLGLNKNAHRSPPPPPVYTPGIQDNSRTGSPTINLGSFLNKNHSNRLAATHTPERPTATHSADQHAPGHRGKNLAVEELKHLKIRQEPRLRHNQEAMDQEGPLEGVAVRQEELPQTNPQLNTTVSENNSQTNDDVGATITPTQPEQQYRHSDTEGEVSYGGTKGGPGGQGSLKVVTSQGKSMEEGNQDGVEGEASSKGEAIQVSKTGEAGQAETGEDVVDKDLNEAKRSGLDEPRVLPVRQDKRTQDEGSIHDTPEGDGLFLATVMCVTLLCIASVLGVGYCVHSPRCPPSPSFLSHDNSPTFHSAKLAFKSPTEEKQDIQKNVKSSRDTKPEKRREDNRRQEDNLERRKGGYPRPTDLGPSQKSFGRMERIERIERAERLERMESLIDIDDEDDDTIYECPGLAPPGEMEVNNPFFLSGDLDQMTGGLNLFPCPVNNNNNIKHGNINILAK